MHLFHKGGYAYLLAVVRANQPSGYSSQVKRIPDTFSSLESYLDSFTCPLIEEVHADVFSSLDGYAHANFIEVVRMEKLDNEKFIFGFEVKEPSKDEKSRETYDPTEGDIIVVSTQKPKHVSDLTQNKASYVLGSVLKCGDDEDFPTDCCIVQLSSSIPVEADPETKMPKGAIFAVFLINMKTYNRYGNAFDWEQMMVILPIFRTKAVLIWSILCGNTNQRYVGLLHAKKVQDI